MNCAALIAAAGLSSRMGNYKPLLKLGELTLAERTVLALRQGGCREIVIITGHNADQLKEHLQAFNPTYIHNKNYAATKMFDSAKLGLSYLKNRCDKLLFLPIDTPLFSENIVRQLLACQAQTAVPCYHGKSGHPLLLDASLIDIILDYDGAGGMHGALQNAGCNPYLLQTDEQGVTVDADTPEEFAQMRALYMQKAAPARQIYLIRHCRPDFGDGQMLCLGKTDLPLGKQGELEAKELRDYFKNKNLSAVYSSDLSRSLGTAKFIADEQLPVFTTPNLHELDCGEWDGLNFSQIKQDYPELYAQRGENPLLTPPGGEQIADGLNRFSSAFFRLLEQTEGNIAVIAHASVNRLLLCRQLGIAYNLFRKIPQPYAAINSFCYQDGLLKPLLVGVKATPVPSFKHSLFLLQDYGTPQKVIEHTIAVCRKAQQLADICIAKGVPLDKELLTAAALLHDIARVKPHHAQTGAEVLRQAGYPALSAPIASHHNLLPEDLINITENTIVFLADKLVQENRECTLEQRFGKSQDKCLDEAANNAHKTRYEQALAAKALIERISGQKLY
ncbi:MAG: histidine phosphatase family protein [Clostridia bacterium]|nr:histidine phosphatase family protein [Clostridia bacterium]